jgi:CRISPR/Cas system endoribonuclease Cas6 (RAMP superfamily)
MTSTTAHGVGGAYQIHFTIHLRRGFVGMCTYHLYGSDEKRNTEAHLTIRQQVYLLAHLAFYAGFDYKTSMGLGQARSM